MSKPTRKPSPKEPQPLCIRITDELRAALSELATRDSRPISAYVRLVLERHVKVEAGLNTFGLPKIEEPR